MKRILIILVSTLLLSLGINAQEGSSQLLRHFSVSAGINSSYAPGIRFEVGTSLTHRLKLRVGIGSSLYQYKFENEYPIVVDSKYEKIVNHINENNVKPKIANDLKAGSVTGQFLLDFSPIRNGIFHITAGFIVGGIHLGTNGALINETTGKHYVQELRDDKVLDKSEKFPIIHSHGIGVKLNHNGSANIDTYVGNQIKPYFGIGIGRTIPNRRIGFKVEIGTFYSGGIKISSHNLFDKNNKEFNKKDLLSIVDKSLEIDDKDADFKSMLKTASILSGFSPSLNLQLIIRLF